MSSITWIYRQEKSKTNWTVSPIATTTILTVLFVVFSPMEHLDRFLLLMESLWNSMKTLLPNSLLQSAPGYTESRKCFSFNVVESRIWRQQTMWPSLLVGLSIISIAPDLSFQMTALLNHYYESWLSVPTQYVPPFSNYVVSFSNTITVVGDDYLKLKWCFPINVLAFLEK